MLDILVPAPRGEGCGPIFIIVVHSGARVGFKAINISGSHIHIYRLLLLQHLHQLLAPSQDGKAVRPPTPRLPRIRRPSLLHSQTSTIPRLRRPHPRAERVQVGHLHLRPAPARVRPRVRQAWDLRAEGRAAMRWLRGAEVPRGVAML